MENSINFEKDLNISYVDESLPKPDNKLILKHCLCSSILYFLIYVFLSNNPFFSEYFVDDIKTLYIFFFYVYVIAAPIIFFTFKPKSIYASHSIEIFNYLKRTIKNICHKNFFSKSDSRIIFKEISPSYKEKQAIILICIKVFFGTLMAKYFYNNIGTISRDINHLSNIIFQYLPCFNFSNFLQMFVKNDVFFYKFSITLLFTIDIFCFLVGYITESSFLKNKIRTVETSFSGIFFCIICYEPFNRVTTSFLNWYSNENYLIPRGEPSFFIWTLRVLAIFFLVIYSLSSVALGTKASNLTNRGIVSRFPYNIVRHPAYISKNLFWLLTMIPLLCIRPRDLDVINYLERIIPIIFSYACWFMIYYFRAITEERHLMQDPDYQEYVKRVRYRFIPFVI